MFSNFIQTNLSLRKDAKSPFEKDMLKLMSSSIYEILLYNARKNNIDNKLVTNLKRFKELNSSPRFKESYPIDENKLIMKLPSDKIELKYPLFVGWFVSELS